MYYPKSKILPDLHTNGGELKDPVTGKEYIGSYHMTYDGKTYEGANHTVTSKELVSLKVKTSSTATKGMVSPDYSYTGLKYDMITDKQFIYLKNYPSINTMTPIPTDTDYANGVMVRYFIKRVNGGNDTIMEVSKQTFEETKKNILYITMSLDWIITGPLKDYMTDTGVKMPGIYDTNQRTLHIKEKEMPGISKYLINPIQFSKLF